MLRMKCLKLQDLSDRYYRLRGEIIENRKTRTIPLIEMPDQRDLITRRGRWSVSGNPHFGHCYRDRSHFTINGVCQICGGNVECAWCGRTKQSDGSYKKVRHCVEENTSHGICPSCKEIVKKKWDLKTEVKYEPA